MSLLFITDFLPPAFSATGQYTYYFANQYANKKIRTTLVGLDNEDKTIEKNKYFKICKIKTIKLNKDSHVNRVLWNIHCCSKICNVVIKERKNFKYLVFNGTPQLLIYFVFLINLFLNKKIIFRTTDFFPETLISSLNNNYAKFFLENILLKLTYMIRKNFYKLQYLGLDQKKLCESHIKVKKYQIKRDFCLIDIPKNEKKEKNFKIILYSGNLGLAHDYETFLKGYENYIKNNQKNKYKLWINASGKGLGDFLKKLKEKKIRYYLTKTVPMNKLGKILSIADVHLVLLKNEFASIVLPSKVFCLLKTKGDIIYIGPKESDIKTMVDSRENGYFISNGEYQRLSKILQSISFKNEMI